MGVIFMFFFVFEEVNLRIVVMGILRFDRFFFLIRKQIQSILWFYFLFSRFCFVDRLEIGEGEKGGKCVFFEYLYQDR